MTLTISVTWVSKVISLLNRCDRSPSPVSVSAYTLCPFSSSKPDTRRQIHPPLVTPGINTNVLREDCARAAPMRPFDPAAARPAPTANPFIMLRRVTFGLIMRVHLLMRKKPFIGDQTVLLTPQKKGRGPGT